MNTEILEIQPRELKFTFELKTQSFCSIQLGNNSENYVAFKVKTTSPNRYCVRPNMGIIKPNATCDFKVTMQAHYVAPPDLQCKDKFLIQSIILPFGTTEKYITSDMFAKGGGRYIEERKLRVVLIPRLSPVLLQINGESKQESCNESSVHKDRIVSGVENVPPPFKAVEDVEGFKITKDEDEFRAAKDVESRSTTEDVKELKPAKDGVFLNLTKDFEELTLKLHTVGSKLKEADVTILNLTEERNTNNREKDMLKHQLEMLRNNSARQLVQVQVGFPFFYLCMIALISLAVGYLVHA